MESSHNGIAAVLKTAVRKDVGVRVPRSPQGILEQGVVTPCSFLNKKNYNGNKNLGYFGTKSSVGRYFVSSAKKSEI